MAGNVYNPSSPSVVGLEWLVNSGLLTQDLNVVGPWAQRIRSRSAETINTIQTAGALTGPTAMLIEIIPAGSEVPPGSVTTNYYEPSGDVAVSGWVNQAASAVNLFQAIDEGIDSGGPVSVADYAVASGAGSSYRIKFASTGFSATARVLRVLLKVAYGGGSKGLSGSATFALRHEASSTDYPLLAAAVAGGPLSPNFTTRLIDLGEINPRTQLPWTPADIQGFGGGSPTYSINAVGVAITFRLYALELQVVTQTVENRSAAATIVASGIGSGITGGLSSGAFVALPGAGVSWAKPASGDFTVLIRKPNYALLHPGVGQPNPLLWYAGSYLAGNIRQSPIPGVGSGPVSLDSYGQVSAPISFVGATAGLAPTLGLRTTAPATSQDSLAYAQNAPSADVSATSTLRQKLTAPASASFSIIKLDLSPGAAVAPINIKIKRVSDNVQFGSTVTFTPDQVRAFPLVGGPLTGWYEISTVMSSVAVLVSGTQYYLELTSTDVSAPGTGWETFYATAVFLTSGDTASFNGATDQGDIGSGYTTVDFPVTLAQPPAAPTGPGAVVTLTTTANWAVAQGGCGVQKVQQILFSWTKTALGASFLRYEIQRTEDVGVTWRTIAYITSSETVQSFTDGETPRGTPVQYRIRVVRTDGIESAWSTVTAGVTAFAVGCEMIFVTNENPALMVAYGREPKMRFLYGAPNRDELIQIYGADYVVAFMESEDPGISFDAQLTVNFAQAPTRDDIGIFAPLRTLARSAVSYVCVLDWTGSRWFAHLQFSEGDWSEPGFNYHALVTVTEISGISSIAIA